MVVKGILFALLVSAIGCGADQQKNSRNGPSSEGVLDPNLKACIDETKADIAQLRYLNCEAKGIKSLAGLENLADDVDSVAVPNNEIVDLGPLAKMPALKELWIYGNKIVNIAPLGEIPSLTHLSMFDNKVADLAPLASTQLTQLTADHNQITNLTPLARLTGMTNLELSNNPIADLSPLGSLVDLKFLYVNNAWVASGLASLTSLKHPIEIQLRANDGTMLCSDFKILRDKHGSDVVERSPTGCKP